MIHLSVPFRCSCMIDDSNTWGWGLWELGSDRSSGMERKETQMKGTQELN